jgi:fructose-1,6-bisphosphatase
MLYISCFFLLCPFNALFTSQRRKLLFTATKFSTTIVVERAETIMTGQYFLLCIVQNEIILSSLRSSGKVAAMASEEDDAPIWLTDDGSFVVVTDPLDGSRNIDASIPTGTIFGIYNRLVELDHLPKEEKATLNSLQTGARLVAAGYVLYSSATILCISFGSGTHAFTLDHSTGDFILTHPSIKIPPRGNDESVHVNCMLMMHKCYQIVISIHLNLKEEN